MSIYLVKIILPVEIQQNISYFERKEEMGKRNNSNK